jgi:hypothetical protein
MYHVIGFKSYAEKFEITPETPLTNDKNNGKINT